MTNISGKSEWAYVAILVLACALLHRPHSRALFVALVALNFAVLVWEAPAINHILFNTMSNGVILCVLLFRRRRGYDEFTAVLRIHLLLLYFFAVLAKLNTDYFNPGLSCGGFFGGQIASAFPWAPADTWARTAALWAGILAEAAIPFLLFFSRTRRCGIALGLVFHSALTLIPKATALYTFSSMMAAMFFLFLPPAALERASGTPAVRFRTTLFTVPATLWAGVVVVFHFFPRSALLLNQVSRETGYGVWLVAATALFFVYFKSIFNAGLKEQTPREFWGPARGSPALAVTAILIFIGLNPYLGLRTAPCFSMYSNLRTEGRTNHFFMPRSLQSFHFQDDLVEVTRSTQPYLRKLSSEHQLLPYLEFWRILSYEKKPLSVEYIRHGQKHFLKKNGIQDTSVIPKIPWWVAKTMRFRPVPKEGPVSCPPFTDRLPS